MATKYQQQTMSNIKLVSECFIKPKHEIDATKQFYHLGPVDIVFLTIDPIQKGLLYTLNNHTTSTFSSSNNHDDIEPLIACTNNKVVSHLLEKLKHSLSIALVHFYPLAGRFAVQTYPNEDACSVYIDCNKGPGARFIHATALDVAVSDILSPVDVTIVHPLFDLGERYVNYDCHTKALLSIQVTELQDGVFVGFSMSHSVVDGTSFIHFVSMLSEIFRSDDSNINPPISRPPIFNYRPWLINEGDPTVLKLPFSDVEKFICRVYDPSPLSERIFHFSPASMAKLKAKANQESGTNDNIISSFQALSALVWRSITRARGVPLDQQATCFLAIGARNRFDPPLSDDYFGNFISKTDCVCNVEELSNNGLGWIATNLKKVIMAQDGKVISDLYKGFANSPFIIPRGLDANHHGVNSVIMGGSARFKIYEPEFGLGRAIAARMGYGNKEDGKITANPGCEGKGSVDLETCLRPHVMAILETDEEFMSFAS